MRDRFKFRVWNVSDKKYFNWEYLRLCSDLGDVLNRGSTQCQVIEQCTGLKDKNGNLIYEGDIIKYENQYWTVFYSVSTLQWGLMGKEHSVYGDKIKRIDTYQINGDIIGNIHENPELLENN